MKKRKQTEQAPPPEDYLFPDSFAEIDFSFPEVDWERMSEDLRKESEALFARLPELDFSLPLIDFFEMPKMDFPEMPEMPKMDFSIPEFTPLPPISWGIETPPPRPEKRRANRHKRKSPKKN